MNAGLMTVEAMQFDGTNGDAIGMWVARHGKPAKVHTQGDGDPEPSYVEFPLKGALPNTPLYHCRANVGMWILLGPAGFERWTADKFERVFHRISIEAKTVGVLRAAGGEGAAERIARDELRS